MRMRAADSLVGFYMRKKEYEKAKKYLEYFSVQNPEKKRKQAQRDEFAEGLRENLKKCFCDEETYGFLKNNKRWKKLME